MTYAELKKKHQDEVNAFPLGFAFGDKQFEEMMSKWGLDAKKDEDLKKIAYLGVGGTYIRRSDIPAWNEMSERHLKELEEFRKDEKNFIDALVYQLHNHEYGYSRSWDDVEYSLEALGIDPKDLEKDEELSRKVQKAIKQCVKEYNEMEDDNEDY